MYSRSAAEGSSAVVRIDNDLDDAIPPVTCPATVTTGGAIEITPAAGELPASAERYWVQIADGAADSWVRALRIVALGEARRGRQRRGGVRLHEAASAPDHAQVPRGRGGKDGAWLGYVRRPFSRHHCKKPRPSQGKRAPPTTSSSTSVIAWFSASSPF